MKNSMKKVLSFFLMTVMCMSLTILPKTVYAQEDTDDTTVATQETATPEETTEPEEATEPKEVATPEETVAPKETMITNKQDPIVPSYRTTYILQYSNYISVNGSDVLIDDPQLDVHAHDSEMFPNQAVGDTEWAHFDDAMEAHMGRDDYHIYTNEGRYTFKYYDVDFIYPDKHDPEPTSVKINWKFTPVTPVTLTTPKVVQTVSGDTPETASQFKYQMVPGDENTPMPGTSNVGVGASLMINGEGETSFGDITYKKPGTYSYTINQIYGSEVGYAYDAGIYKMTVKVETVDDTQNPIALKASYTLTKEGQTKDDIGFLNTYNKPSNPNTNKNEPNTNKEDPTTRTTVVKDTTNKASSSTPKTGDDANIMIYLFTMMTSLASILFMKKRLSNH